jgi:hypothetical protein
MRSQVLCLTIVLSAVLFALPAASRPQTAPVSWGKAGVAFDDYRQDAAACGKQGATTSMKGRGEYDAVMLGLDRQDLDIDTARSLPPSATLEEPAEKLARDYGLNSAKSRPEPKVRALQTFLERQVEICLSEKGYVRFSLTPGQALALGRYKKGSEERFRFLHGLASDEAILRRQRLEP